MADARKFTRSVGRNAAKAWDTGSRGAQPSADPVSENFKKKRPLFSSVLKRKREPILRPYNMTKEDVDEAIDSGGKRAKRISWAGLKNTHSPDTPKLHVAASTSTPCDDTLCYLPSWNKRIEPKTTSSKARFEEDDYGQARTNYWELFDISPYSNSDWEFDHIDPKMQTLIELAVERAFAVPVLKLINQALSHDQTKPQCSAPTQPQRGNFPTASRTGYQHAGPSKPHRSSGSGIDGNDPVFTKPHATHPTTWDITATPGNQKVRNSSSPQLAEFTKKKKYPALRPIASRARGEGEFGSERARQALAAAFKPREEDPCSDDESFKLLSDEARVEYQKTGSRDAASQGIVAPDCFQAAQDRRK